MHDDQLLQDLDILPYARKEAAALRENGVTTYTQLFALLRDETTDLELRNHACFALARLSKPHRRLPAALKLRSSNPLDYRRAIPPLLIALQSPDEELRSSAAHALGMLHSRRAVTPLINLLRDTSQPEQVRHDALDALTKIDDKRAIPLFHQIIDDPHENIYVRSRAIELISEEPDPIPRFMGLLSDPSPDIRFWAAYRLAQSFDDMSLSREALDHVVAFDHTLPKYWGWHVDREAIYPLGTLYYQQIVGSRVNEDGETYLSHPRTMLISPAPEYSTLLYDYRKWTEDWTYQTIGVPPVTLIVDPQWLADKLRSHWPDVELDTWQPRPQAYMFTWKLKIGDEILIGGLHRDQYAVALTGDETDAYEFAAWYRSIIAPDQPLFFYEWADSGIELSLGITGAELERLHDQRHEERRAGGQKAVSNETS